MNQENNCQKFQDMMEASFGRKLDAENQGALDQHLKACMRCKTQWEQFQILQQGLDQLEDMEPPSELVIKRIQKAAADHLTVKQKTNVSPSWRFLLSRPVMVAAMFLLVAGVGVYSQYWLKQQPELIKLNGSPPEIASEGDDKAIKLAPEKKELRLKAKPSTVKIKAMDPLTTPPPPAERFFLEAPQGTKSKIKLKKQDEKQDETISELTPQQMQLIASGKARLAKQDLEGACKDFKKALTFGDHKAIRLLLKSCQN